MKYVLMFTSRPDLDAALPPERAEAVYQEIFQWFADNRDIVIGGPELQPIETATTVRYGPDGPVVVDGPFTEAKEVVGGFTVIDVPDLDRALAVASTWPALAFPGVAVEVRPVVDHS